MDKQFLFTHERLSKLPVPDVGRAEYFDTKQQKLRIRVTTTGAKSFAVVKKSNNKPKRVTIGKWPEVSISKARDEAIKILDEIRQGVDPTAVKHKKVIESTKLIDVLERYLSGRDLKPYTVKDYRYKLKLGFNDWLKRPVSDITEDMVLKRHKKISQTGKTTANTTMRVLRLTLNYANAVGMIDSNPTSILSKARLWHKNNRKDRVIPSNRLQVWHEAVEELANQKAKVYLLMALYMGFRSSELLTLEWSHVDIKAKSITLYDTKNGTNHRLPIPIVLLPYIKDLHDLTGDYIWVFAGDKPGRPMAIPTKPIKTIINISGVEFSPHDCRRTFATISEAVNLPMSMIKRLMNHVTTNDVTGGYIVTEEETLSVAINKVADYIQSRVGQQDNVIQLGKVNHTRNRK
ncbi:MAG: integrase [Oleiphilaceae bacterium]|jgi:integrase